MPDVTYHAIKVTEYPDGRTEVEITDDVKPAGEIRCHVRWIEAQQRPVCVNMFDCAGGCQLGHKMVDADGGVEAKVSYYWCDCPATDGGTPPSE